MIISTYKVSNDSIKMNGVSAILISLELSICTLEDVEDGIKLSI